MKMSKCKKKIIALIILTIIMNYMTIINVNAAKTNESKTTTTSTCNAETEKTYKSCTSKYISTEYNPSYDYTIDNSGNAKIAFTTVKGTLKIAKIEEGAYDDDAEVFTPVNGTVLVSNANKYIGKIIYNNDDSNKKNNPTFTIAKSPSSDRTYVKVTLVISGETDCYCDSAEAFEKKYGVSILTAKEEDLIKKDGASARIELFIPAPDNGKVSSEINTNYDTIYCQFMRSNGKDNNINQQILKDGIIDSTTLGYFNEEYKTNYQKLIPGCYSPYNVRVNYTYTEKDKQLANIIKNTITSVHYQKNIENKASSEAFKNSGKSFEEMKNRANNKEKTTSIQHTWEFTDMPDKIEVSALKCEYQKNDINLYKSRNNDGSYYYANNEYFYAVASKPITVQYDHDYDGIKVTDNPVTVCEKKCEESVEVSYGAPQAVVAGFCFEYQMRVISKVVCNVNVNPDAAPQLQGYCTPVPRCEHKNNLVLKQAGPDEEFKACVKNCDGGKYTQSCSRSCYNKIYGAKGIKKESLLTYNATIQPVANVESNGKYVRQNGEIVWSGTGFARWYAESDTKTYKNFSADSKGFKRKHLGESSECDGVCHNTGCEGNVFLNPESAQADYEHNMNLYQGALSECNAGATCSTKTSTYKIKVKEYPEFKSETLQSEKTNQVKDNGILLDSGGCYNSTNIHDYYKAEWSFPGTWVNNKTGEISFKPITSGGWHSVPNKFCLPLDAKSTNSDWWNWYMKKAQGTTSSEKGTGSYKTEEYNNTCTTISKATNDPKTISSNSIDWNINGSAENFGYFHWTFNISCFYATPKKETTPPKCETPSLNAYTTRTVDNQDLFPSTDESGKATTSASATGRTPGYNWTKAATIDGNNGKNPNYQVDPTVLIEKIQKLKGGVYNDNGTTEDYLDYRIVLTPENINAIKRDIKQGNLSYEKWDMNTTESKYEDNMIKYVSSFIRNDKYTSKDGRKLGLPGCNNQVGPNECAVLLK
ncbi:MAG: hypothetical protein IKH54_07000 [Bacilli bacterium]|nr:hypothetical protein [Bacilli bacterium]